jgi:hypothetical protein
VVNVVDFGARGDGRADDAAAVQRAIDSLAGAGGTVHFPQGVYRLTRPLVPRDFTAYTGVGGYEGSVLLCAHADGAFRYAALQDCRFQGLCFRATVAGAAGFRQASGSAQYTAVCRWESCVFSAELSEGIHANLVLCHVRDCSFGYYFGEVAGQTQRRHIYSRGNIAGLSTNMNTLTANRFYRAFGVPEACCFDAGFMLTLRDNNFERNATRCLTASGMFAVHLTENWFEANTGLELLAFVNEATATQGNYVVTVDRNWFQLTPANAQVMTVAGGHSVVSFTRNAGTLFAGKRIAQSGSAFSEYHGNYFVGDLAEVPRAKRE